jgi:GNAT superfamily N-acetyltransferase
LSTRHVPAVLRERREQDIARLATLLEVIQPIEGYPKSRPESLEAFVRDRRVIGAWVIEEDGVVMGHALIKQRSLGGIDDIVHEHTTWPKDRLAEISRLFVATEARGKGYARTLLRHCASEARRLNYLPYLDVDMATPAPRALYASEGWQSLAITTLSLPSGISLEVEVMVPPGT